MAVLHYLGVAVVLPLLIFAPGYLALVRLRGIARAVFAPGVTVLGIGGLAALSIPSGLSGRTTSYILVGACAAAALAFATLAIHRPALRPSGAERPALLVFLGCYVFLVGFNLMPSNPPGSINPCAPVEAGKASYIPPVQNSSCAVYAPPSLTMSRIPNRSIDDLLQYRTAQAIWNRHLYGASDFAGGWRLQDRTPLLGLMVAGLASVGTDSLPVGFPPQLTFPIFGKPGPLWYKRWGAPTDSSITPKTQPSAFVVPGYRPPLIDAWGYWFYRLLTMLLASLVILPTYYFATKLGGARVGVLAGVAAGITPAIMQNAYYTSPKYLAVYFGMCAVALFGLRKPAWAGAALAAAYLAHPFGLILGVPALGYALWRSRRGAAIAVMVIVLLVAPWSLFTTTTGHSSSLFANPLGCVGPTVTFHDCLHQFASRPTAGIVWQRLAVIPQMVLPFGIDSTLQPDGRLGFALKWLTIHDFSFPGMVGFAFFGIALFGVSRAWRVDRDLFWWLVVAQMALIGVFWGIPGQVAWVAGLGLLPFIFIFGALGLASLSATRARWLGAFIALESVSYIFALYHPIAGTSLGQYAFGWLFTLGGLGSMLFAAYAALFWGWPERNLDLARPPGSALRAKPSPQAEAGA